MDLHTIKEKIRQDPILSKLWQLAKEKTFPLFLVGGYLRDLLLGTVGKDYDFALPKSAAPFLPEIEETLQLRFFRIGKEESNTVTHRFIKEDLSIDMTFLQGETIEEDLLRRDFTINAMAFSFQEEIFFGLERGWKDIEKKCIRAVSDRSLEEDPLRMLRAVRYSCVLKGFEMEEELKKEIALKKDNLLMLPGERIKAELDQILLSPRPAMGMKALYELNLLFTLFPEMKGLEKLGQNEHHHLDVLAHTLLMIEKLSGSHEWVTRNHRSVWLDPENRLVLSYAALFHDLGKQDTYSKDEKDKVHFYFHESFSAITAEKIMERLRFSNWMKNKILPLIQHHMRILNLSSETKESALKRLVHQIGEEIPLLVLLTLSDKEASRGILSIQMDEIVENHCLRILDLFHQKEIVHPPPLITGHDVIALGYSPGPKVGQILNFIRQKQVEGELQNREEALRMLKIKFGIE